MKRFGYVYTGKRTSSAQAQRRNIIAAGVSPGDIFADGGEDRNEREWLVQGEPQTLRPGDVVVIACEAYIGRPGRDRRRFLAQLAERGVLLQVRDGEPVLYDSEDKIRAFLDTARRVSQADSAREARKLVGGASGRPGKLDALTDAEMQQARDMWATRAHWREVADWCADKVKAHGLPRPDLTHANMWQKFGPRGGK